jgi:molybdenum cofactor cytidylyltransferase
MTGRVAALILAAGASVRMGSPKALLPWGDSTLLDQAIGQARAAGVDELVVVLGPATQHLTQSLAPHVRVALNPDPATGRSTSIRLGCAQLPDALDVILIQSVDQPASAELLEVLFAAVTPGVDVVVPTFEGRRGHPVCLAGHLLPELVAITEEEEGLRSIVRRHAARLVEVPVTAESVVWNLNDPAAYAAARLRK